ncbi:MAG: DNA polymerase III subunit epsilon [Neomegalonema sp.]|nr:DNA polymerase III subunit epsilon [Neomegalonema sp.]
MREISLDTETTGLDPATGDRIVEIGCVELINHVPTGENFHVYIDPLRPMSAEATEITGITDEMLRGKPTFDKIARDFRDFIGDDMLVIHNASFDVKFINAEFARVGLDRLDLARVCDTLTMARRKFPGAQANLDALCRRFGIDNSSREKHGALLDAELLAEVYLELIGGRQPDLVLTSADTEEAAAVKTIVAGVKKRPYRSTKRLTPEEHEAHRAFVETLGENALWKL